MPCTAAAANADADADADDDDDDDDEARFDVNVNVNECPHNNTVLSFCFLPEEVLENAALYLSTRDVLSLLSVNRRLSNGLGKSTAFWEMLLKRDDGGVDENENKHKHKNEPQRRRNCYSTAKKSYLFRCHKTNPTKSGGGVQWYPVRPYGQFAGISDREGHISCVLKSARQTQILAQTQAQTQLQVQAQAQAVHDDDDDDDPSTTTNFSAENEKERQKAANKSPQERIVVITGGFSNDDCVCK